jgi:hypothetical protein
VITFVASPDAVFVASAGGAPTSGGGGIVFSVVVWAAGKTANAVRIKNA